MVRQLDASADWLTVTTQNYADTEYLQRLAARHLGADPGARPWSFRDYHGHRRHDASGKGGIAYADKDAGCRGILQSWGALTATVGRQLASDRVKPTRVDLAVTVLHDEPQKSILDLLPELQPEKHKLSAIIPLCAEGGTLYVGHRGSDAFGRLYDKGAQLGADIPDRLLWRYEVEYKRKLAEQAAGVFWSGRYDQDYGREFVLANVEEFFREHDVPVPFTSKDVDKASLVRYATRIQDDHRTLKWLSEQVHPAVMRLALNGKADAVCQALGVDTRDGVPSFEAEEVIPPYQLTLWAMLDISADL
jgi:hypothetical protein